MEIEESGMRSGVVRKRENRGRSGSPPKHKLNICKKASPVDFDDWLDENAVSEILVRLPVMSVTRFQLVCKSWRSLISCDYFHSLHTLTLRKSPPPLFLTVVQWRNSNSNRGIIKTSELFYLNRRIIERGTEKQRTIPCYLFKLNNYFNVLRSSNGLLLLMNYRLEYNVYNPTTDHSEKVPRLGELLGLRGYFHFVYDPFKSPHYKIVLIHEMLPRLEELNVFNTESVLRFHVFNSETGTWSVCVHSETMTHYKSLFYLIYRARLYCFNIVKNVSQYIVCPLPQVRVYSYTLQEANASLYYCGLVRDAKFQSTAALLWELPLNGDDPRRSNWLLKYHHIDPRLPNPVWTLLDMLAFVTETSTILIYIGGKIMAYNFVYKSYTEVVDIQPGDYVHVHQIAETLALP